MTIKILTTDPATGEEERYTILGVAECCITGAHGLTGEPYKLFDEDGFIFKDTEQEGLND